MWPSRAKRGPTLQKPISCHFCRTRKLRCNRQFPCTNCTTRGISCQSHTSQVLPVGSRPSKEDEPMGSNSELLARLQKLEEIVMRKCGQDSTDVIASSDASSTRTHSYSQQYRTQPAAATDSEWLEREFMFQYSFNSILPDKIAFRTCPIQQITKSASYIYPNPPGPFSSGEPTKCIWIPLYEESKIMLEKYLNEITYIHHVVHSPSVRVTLDLFYDDLSQQKDVKPGHVALLLSILASATYSWNARDPRDIFPTVGEAENQSASWVKATLDVLEYSRRTTSGSLEDIQATIILSFVVCSLEGMSSRFRSLISMAIMLARDLSLHRIDHPASSAMITLPSPDSIQAEVGRRVWWYLVATDWMLSGYISPQEGTYVVNPNHMAVHEPRNINDEDLIDGVNMELPLTQPTIMSYFIQRIRLAHICREFTDQIPFSDLDPGGMTYDRVLEVDAKFVKYIEGLPPFFSYDSNVGDIAQTDSWRAPAIIITKYIFHSLIHARRCKLHVHYMVRGFIDPKYARSREICLRAARMIIQTERLLEMEDVPFVLTRLKSCGLLYCIVMAIIVFLLDICFNKDFGNTELRKAEVLDACSILEEARGQSAIAVKLLDSLMSILPRHQISIPGLNGAHIDVHDSSAMQTSSLTASAGGEPSLDRRNSNPQGQNSADAEISYFDEITYFDEIWQGFNGGVNMDEMDWNGVLSDLDSWFQNSQA